MSRLTKAGALLAVGLWTACGGERHEAVQVEQPLHMPIERLDRAVFAAVQDTTGRAFQELPARFGDFYRVYVEDILHAAPVTDPRLSVALTRFALDPDWSSAQRDVDSVLGDLTAQQEAFDEAFSRLHALFPDSLVPRIIAFDSGYNYGIVPTDSVLGIGLEWFIGSDRPVVARLAPDDFPQYVKARMVPALLVPSAVKGWLLTHYTRDVSGADVLTNLVEVGKVLALMEVLLPGADPSTRFAFSPAQLEWCEANEFNIWRELVAKDQLYSKKEEDVARLMNDAPFTSGFPHESPGHIGEWIGYRMVRSYLDAHPEITFPQLFALDDPRAILKSYKPR